MSGPQILVIDNVDSFTFMLVDYLKRLGAQVVVKRNDALTVQDVIASDADGIMISPGPGKPEQAGIAIEVARACIERQQPLLGVCLGHQAIALACGSAVRRATPVHGKLSSVRHDGSGLFKGLPSPFAATRYHSLAVIDPCSPLRANAWSDEGTVMGMCHDRAPAHGIQFHPESVASEQGAAILSNFLAICQTPA